MELFERLKGPAERLYNGRFTLIGYEDREDKTTHITNQEEVIEAKNIPCRISYQSTPNANQTDTGAALVQSIKLFCAPDVAIRAGSKIIVTQNGKETVYVAAGEAVVYASHREVELVLEKEWA